MLDIRFVVVFWMICGWFGLLIVVSCICFVVWLFFVLLCCGFVVVLMLCFDLAGCLIAVFDFV